MLVHDLALVVHDRGDAEHVIGPIAVAGVSAEDDPAAVFARFLGDGLGLLARDLDAEAQHLLARPRRPAGQRKLVEEEQIRPRPVIEGVVDELEHVREVRGEVLLPTLDPQGAHPRLHDAERDARFGELHHRIGAIVTHLVRIRAFAHGRVGRARGRQRAERTEGGEQGGGAKEVAAIGHGGDLLGGGGTACCAACLRARRMKNGRAMRCVCRSPQAPRA